MNELMLTTRSMSEIVVLAGAVIFIGGWKLLYDKTDTPDGVADFKRQLTGFGEGAAGCAVGLVCCGLGFLLLVAAVWLIKTVWRAV